MSEIISVLRRELIYIWYYFDIQLRQIFWYWVIGMAIGSLVSVFAKDKIHGLMTRMSEKRLGIIGIIPACLLGIASPLCMYGTIPIAASFRRKGMRQDWLAAFMTASILLNPQLIIYSAALGAKALAVRMTSCFVGGCAAGLRNVRATGLYFLFGILLSALFQRYVPQSVMTGVFGGSEAWGVLMAATIGVPLYACGGGTIPLLVSWLDEGMSLGSAAAFMITGPATKITNLGALKSAMGWGRFLLYIAYIMVFSLVCGLIVNAVL